MELHTMTVGRAIEILDPEHREHYDGLDEVNEACRMGMEALREAQRYQQAEKDGRLKVGDTVYQTDGFRVYESKVKGIIFDAGHFAFNKDAKATV